MKKLLTSLLYKLIPAVLFAVLPLCLIAQKPGKYKGHIVINNVETPVTITIDSIVPVPATPVPSLLPSVRIDDFKLATDSDYYNAWNKAKKALVNGGTILFDSGVYNISTPTSDMGWLIEKDNLTIKGAGTNKTTLTASPNIGVVISNYTRLSYPYVRGYSTADSAFTFTYKNTLQKGDSFITLKDIRFADSIKVGDRMLLTAGSHYYDQDFGELVTIIGKDGANLRLKDPLFSSYKVDSVPYGSKLTNDFVIPAIGDTASAYLNSDSLPAIAGRFCSIGDNIFLIKSKNFVLRSITFINIGGKGNAPAGTILPIGTKVMKGRTLLIWNHTKNLKIQDLTITGKQNRIARLDNTYDAELTNVNVVRDNIEKKGFVYTTDFSRGIAFYNDTFRNIGASGASQISRSAGDISFKKCTHDFVKPDCSEFCFNVSFDSSLFNLKGAATFTAGGSCRRLHVTNSLFNLDSTVGLFYASEVQGLNNVQREYCLISGNTFNILNYSNTLIDLPFYGLSIFSKNIIKGGVLESISATLGRIPNGTGWYPSEMRIDSNYIEATIRKGVLIGGLFNGRITGNTVRNTGLLKAQVMYTYNTQGLKSLLISNNTFENFTTPIKTITGVVLTNNVIK